MEGVGKLKGSQVAGSAGEDLDPQRLSLLLPAIITQTPLITIGTASVSKTVIFVLL